jgi:hypothetical protein
MLKLQLVHRAISDKYVIQWLESVRKDLRTYNDFKIAFTDLLWNSAVQAEVRNAIYLDKYDKQSGESYSAHFLEHSARATYLSPRMSEIDLITAISNHFPVHITRSILSANITNIKDALTFLRRLEALEPKGNTQSKHEPGTSQVGGSPSASRQNYRENRAYNRPQQAERSVRQFSFNRNQNFREGSGPDHRQRQSFERRPADSRRGEDGYRNHTFHGAANSGQSSGRVNATTDEFHPNGSTMPQNRNHSGGSQPEN